MEDRGPSVRETRRRPVSEALAGTRRDFLRISAISAGGLVLGVRFARAAEAPSGDFRPNAWVRIDPSGKVTLTVDKSEMGQGVRTSLPMILAEELEVDVDTVELFQASPGPEFQDMGTYGSRSTRTLWMPLRTAGAAAREMLIAAAAAQWGVAVSACRAENGRVLHAESKRSRGLRGARGGGEPSSGARVAGAETEVAVAPDRKGPPPCRRTPHRRRRAALRLRRAAARHEVRERGPLPGRRRQARSPGTTRRRRRSRASAWSRRCPRGSPSSPTTPGRCCPRARPSNRRSCGTRAPMPPSARRKFWPACARRSRRRRSAAALDARIRGSGGARGGRAEARGRVLLSLPGARSARDDERRRGRDIGALRDLGGHQAPNRVQTEAAKLLGVPESAVDVHVTLLGGGFGRRGRVDFALDAVECSRAAGAPVRIVWTRSDDMRNGDFHPDFAPPPQGRARRLRASRRHGGTLVSAPAWPATTAALSRRAAARRAAGRLRPALRDPGLRSRDFVATTPVRVSSWRSVQHNHNVFAAECFFDELALAAGKDPAAYRLGAPPARSGRSGRARGRARRPGASRGGARARRGEGEVVEQAPGRPRQGRGLRVLRRTDAGRGRRRGDGRPVRRVARRSHRLRHRLRRRRQSRSASARRSRARSRGRCRRSLPRSRSSAGVSCRRTTATFRSCASRTCRRSRRTSWRARPPPTGTGEPPGPITTAAVANALSAACGRRVRRLPVRANDLKGA